MNIQKKYLERNKILSQTVNPDLKEKTGQDSENSRAMQQIEQEYEQLKMLNSSKANVMFTTENFPSFSLYPNVAIPLSVFIKPLGDLTEETPAVEFSQKEGKEDLPRCEECRSFVNPFFKFSQEGFKMKCNLCDTVQNVPKYYYSQLDDKGKRENLSKSPELLNGTVEFIASDDYTARVPNEPTYFFLIDISKSSVDSYIPYYALNAIKEVIQEDRLNGERQCSIGIGFMGRRLHLLNFESKSIFSISPDTDLTYRISKVNS